MATRTRSFDLDPAAGARWLALGRICAAGVLAGLALLAGEEFRSPDWILFAAGVATLTAGLGWWVRRRRGPAALLFLVDVAWVSLSVIGAGRAEAGLGLLFALVAFAAGLCLGGRFALPVSLVAGVALVATARADRELTTGPGWMLVQGILVLALGAASHQTRSHLASRLRDLDEASRALERMRLDTDTLVEELGSGLLSVDADGRVAHLNRAGGDTLGVDARFARGRPVREVFPEGLEPLARLLEAGLQTGRRCPRSEIEIRRRGGKVPLGVGTTVLFGPDNRPTGVVALFQDLTEVRRQEIQDRRRDRLAAVGELAAGIAHEIRNSVLPIRGSVELLAQSLPVKPEEAKLFEVAVREADNIERFVSALLRYSANRVPEPKAIHLAELARQAAEDLRLSGGEAVRISLAVDDVTAWGDEEHLRQALRNLVMNAADAVGSQGEVVLRTGSLADGRVWIEVEDDGPGVPAELRGRLFQPFTSGKPGGTGLGLAVVSRIVEEHEGSLEYLPGASGGARFRITLVEAEGVAAASRAA